MKESTIVICGAGGFIGGHLVRALLENGYSELRAVDRKPLAKWFQRFESVDNRSLDLSIRTNAYEALQDADWVYNLAADMGGMGFIENHKAFCMLSVLINTHLLMAARDLDVKRYFFSSSACVYNAEKQNRYDVEPLKEEDAYPALPEDGYGWEKLFSERMCRHFREDFGLETRVARFHNVYGPFGTYDGGREKAPAALCRKVAEAKLSDSVESVEIWGTGEQTRSFMFIDDCIKGTQMIMESDIQEPVNLGSNDLVTINELVDLIENVAGVRVDREYDTTKPTGVNGRNSDNTKLIQHLDWEPDTPLEAGIETTYRWIEGEMIHRIEGDAAFSSVFTEP